MPGCSAAAAESLLTRISTDDRRGTCAVVPLRRVRVRPCVRARHFRLCIVFYRFDVRRRDVTVYDKIASSTPNRSFFSVFSHVQCPFVRLAVFRRRRLFSRAVVGSVEKSFSEVRRCRSSVSVRVSAGRTTVSRSLRGRWRLVTDRPRSNRRVSNAQRPYSGTICILNGKRTTRVRTNPSRGPETPPRPECVYFRTADPRGRRRRARRYLARESARF